MTKDVDPFVEEVSGVLRRDVESVSAEVAAQLDGARRQAVAVASAAEAQGFGRWGMKGAVRPVPRWPSIAGFGAVMGVALTVTVMVRAPQLEPLPFLNADEMAAVENVELLEELEFVAWVAAMEAEDEVSPHG